MAILDRCTGPACPNCGCEDTTITVKPPPAGPPRVDSLGRQLPSTWWGSGKARCNFCHQAFFFREVEEPAQTPPLPAALPIPAEIDPLAGLAIEPLEATPEPQKAIPFGCCPKCGGKGLVKSVQGGFQYRKCKQCGENFKTVKPAK